jgi:pimeloyl-ACP methyl ester carboxylesterase
MWTKKGSRTTTVPVALAIAIAMAWGAVGMTAVAIAGPTDAWGTFLAIAHEHRCHPNSPVRCGSVTVPLDRSGNVPGTIDIGYRRYPHSDVTQPALETIVAVEGGPGYATTASASSYVSLFRPMMDRHDLLLVDLRGTGSSDPVNCEALQQMFPPYADWVEAVKACGEQLGDTSNLYGTADAADDLASIMDALNVDTVDLYGDSYGTFFSQVFAIRHPDRVRSVVLDAAYPVQGADPWWRDLSRAAASGYRLACTRDPGCSALPGDPVARLRRLDRQVAEHPITGTAPDGDGVMGKATIDPSVLIQILDAGGYVFDPYRELDAAVRAALKPNPDTLPLLRLAREEVSTGNGGPVRGYSQGLAVAAECTDYPQLYPMDVAPADRFPVYTSAIQSLMQNDPNAFVPFTVNEAVTSPDEDYDTCLNWPVPAFAHPLLPPGATYPDVPTLVLVGDLDSVTSAEGARAVAESFPSSTFVEVPNMVHVTALGDSTGCAAGIVVRFVRTLDAGNTSCVDDYPEVRTVDAFTQRAQGLHGSETEKAALVAVNTVADVMARWDVMSGYYGAGLRGGTFSTTGYNERSWHLHHVRWVANVGVSGSVRLDAMTGSAAGDVTLSGRYVGGWHLHLRWNVLKPLATVAVRGRDGARTFRLTVPVA